MELAVEKINLHQPDLQELAAVLLGSLQKNFQTASVVAVDCPDLTSSPWNLAGRGLCGSPRLLDIGGVPNLIPVPKLSKIYDLGKMVTLAQLPGAFVIGAGAGSCRVAGTNCELMPNATTPSCGTEELNLTYIAKVSDQDGSCVLEKYSSLESGLLANILACEGKPGKVLEIRVKKRTGPENFVTCLRKALNDHYGTNPVGLGGTFQILSGKANIHVMPKFSCTPLNSEAEVDKWLCFYDMPAPLICLSVLISHDPGLDLRVEHTHCFSSHGCGGHYHNDVTPDDVEYLGYYTVCEQLYRIDRPLKS